MSIQLPPAVQRVVDAINGADTEAFVAAFTADGRVDDWGRVLEGSEGVRSWAQTDAIGQQARMESRPPPPRATSPRSRSPGPATASPATARPS